MARCSSPRLLPTNVVEAGSNLTADGAPPCGHCHLGVTYRWRLLSAAMARTLTVGETLVRQWSEATRWRSFFRSFLF